MPAVTCLYTWHLLVLSAVISLLHLNLPTEALKVLLTHIKGHHHLLWGAWTHYSESCTLSQQTGAQTTVIGSEGKRASNMHSFSPGHARDFLTLQSRVAGKARLVNTIGSCEGLLGLTKKAKTTLKLGGGRQGECTCVANPCTPSVMEHFSMLECSLQACLTRRQYYHVSVHIRTHKSTYIHSYVCAHMHTVHTSKHKHTDIHTHARTHTQHTFVSLTLHHRSPKSGMMSNRRP